VNKERVRFERKAAECLGKHCSAVADMAERLPYADLLSQQEARRRLIASQFIGIAGSLSEASVLLGFILNRILNKCLTTVINQVSKIRLIHFKLKRVLLR